MKQEIDNLLFERAFKISNPDGSMGSAGLRIWKPYVDESKNKNLIWRCPYQIVGVGAEKMKEAPGRDALDALLNSVRLSNVLLDYYKTSLGLNLTWFDEEWLGLSEPSENVEETQDALADNEAMKSAFEKFFRERGSSSSE